MPEILGLAAELTRQIVVVEFMAPEDVMFRLTRGREELHNDLTPLVFENMCRRQFEIIRVQRAAGSTSWLYLFKRR